VPRWSNVSRKAKVIWGIIAAIITGLTAYNGYKTTGADELRTRVYQPLYSDLVVVEQALQTVSAEKPPVMKALSELRQTGAFARVPIHLRERIVKLSDDVSRFHTAIFPVRELVVRETSSRISQVRSENAHRVWHEKTVNVLRQRARSQKGFSDSVSLGSFRHEGRSRGIYLRDPRGPMIDTPGGPTFVVRDWVEYPASIRLIEELWTDEDYLYFNENVDGWYYQLTREDLQRLHTSLTEFLRPVYEILKQNDQFNLLINVRSALLLETRDIQAVLTDRVRDPKPLGDWVWR